MGLSLDSFIQLEQKFLWLALILTIVYFWTTSTYGFWSSLGVPFKRPVPLFGNTFKAAFNIKTTIQIQQEIYNEFKGCPLVGTYLFMKPKLMIKDPELIEHVMVKDFSAFMDRGTGIDPNREGLSAHLVNLTGQRWKSLRGKLTPVFTSGKMKNMMPQLEHCSKRLKAHLEKEIVKGNPLEAKYQMSGYTMDVIGSCAFGLDFNAIDDPNSVFRQVGERIFASSRVQVLRRWINEKMPKLLWIFKKFSSLPNIQKYFINLIQKTIQQREEQNIVRQDFIQLMMEIRKQEINKTAEENEVLLDDRVVTSNSFVFLLAGYETTASTLSFMLYELAVNPDIQERLYREVTKVLRKHNGELNWDILKEMEYLDQIKSETLRKYPPAGEIRRLCIKKYSFPNTHVEIPPGTSAAIPVYSLHHDPQYYPNPEKFDPDRFAEKNKHKLVKYTYLPFGAGPRICIGMRFAIMEIKMAIIRLILDFSVTLNPKTISPLKMDPGAILLAPIGGIWLDFAPRNKVSD